MLKSIVTALALLTLAAPAVAQDKSKTDFIGQHLRRNIDVYERLVVNPSGLNGKPGLGLAGPRYTADGEVCIGESGWNVTAECPMRGGNAHYIYLYEKPPVTASANLPAK
jgi:hypothetical protein